MTREPDANGRPRYGAIEIKDSMQLYWMTGLGIAIAIHMAVLISYKLAAVQGSGGLPAPFVPGGPVTWYQPPLNPVGQLPVVSGGHATTHVRATPVPVPIAEVDPDNTLPPNSAPNLTGHEGDGGTGEGVTGGGETGAGGGDGPIVIPDGPPEPFVAVEEMPKVIRRVPAMYPEVALLANLEGTVYVKLWVDKEGKPRDPAVERSNADIFNEAALAAARQFLFTPAYMNSGPVAVWVSIPFKFRIADRK